MATYHLSVKVGKRGSGGAHADYVQRTGAYENYRSGEDLAYKDSVNMPGWAAHNPSEFFRQADIHERANGSAYREFEVALPRELTPEQRIELVREFVQQEIGDRHPCTWAIHNPAAAIEGDDQPHAHIMFSDRRLDGIERGPDQFFKRANSKAPEKGGCAKANLAATKAERKAALVELRGRFADLQNRHLAEQSHAARVDHRSLKDQGIDRQPERHLGPVNARDRDYIEPLLQHRDANAHADSALDEARRIDAPKIINHLKREKANERRQQQQRAQHRQYAARTEAPRLDRVPRMHERRHYGDAPRAKHLLHGNAFDRLGERQAAERAYRVQLENDRAARLAANQRIAEAGLLMQKVRELEKQAAQAAIKATATKERQSREARRGAWQVKHYSAPSLSRSGAAPTPGKPVVWKTAKGIPLVVDYGDRIKATGKPEKAADKAAALVDVAKRKGWASIVVTGPEAFQLAVAEQALKQGVTLADKGLQARAEHKAFTAATLAKAEALAAQERENARMLKEQEAAKALAASTSKPEPTAKPSARQQWREALHQVEKVKAARGQATPKPEAEPTFWEQARAAEARMDALAKQTPPPSPSLPEQSKPAAQPLAALPRAPELLGREKDHAQRLVEDKQIGEAPAAVKAYIAEERRLVDAEREIVNELASAKPIEHTATGIRAEAERTARAQVGSNHWNNYGEPRLENERWHAAKALREHEATKRPSLFGGKGWDAQRGALAASVGDLDKQIAARDAALAAITERESRALTAKYKAEEAAKAERRGELGKRLEDVREQRAVHLSKQPAELKQQRQQRAAKALEKSRSRSQSRGGNSL